MSNQPKDLVLSRFFDTNVQLVAKMCPRCYEECVDVKIVAVDFSFIQQTSNNFNDLKPEMLELLSQAICTSDVKVGDGFLGFTEEEIASSTKSSEEWKKGVEYFAKQEVKRNDFNNNSDRNSFVGFSANEIEDSKDDYHNFVEVSKAASYKIYKRLDLKTIKNICTNKLRNRHRKTNRRKLSVAHSHEKESKYFKSEPNPQESHSKYFSTSQIKEEKGCEHIEPKTAIIDYESEYFDAFNRKDIKIKLEPLPMQKEGFEHHIPKEDTLWIPPRSPHNLIEEVLYHDPWALLVATIFLNRTSCMCARPYVFWFLTENPNALVVLEKFPEDLEKYFVKLGLQRTRALQVWRMSHDFVHSDWKNVRDLYGIGEYGENAFKMFCLGDFNVAPKDRFLRIYKAWYEKILLNNEGDRKDNFNACDINDGC